MNQELIQPSRTSTRRRIALWSMAAAATFGLIHCTTGKDMWTKESTTFFKTDKPYGAGDFRIKGNQVFSIKVSEPEIKIRKMTAEELAKPDSRAEVTEPWMADSGETLNRMTARFVLGTIDGDVTSTFKEPAQRSAWWVSDNWQIHFLATNWMDYNGPDTPVDIAPPSIQKIFKSTDGGKTWVQLEWPRQQRIDMLRFIDGNRGYATGQGPRYWRTIDGGLHWQHLPTPPKLASTYYATREFDLSTVDADGTLWLAGFGLTGQNKGRSAVFAMPWQNQPELSDKEAQALWQFDIPDQTVIDMQVRGGKVWVLTRTGQPAGEALPVEGAPPAHNELLLWQEGKLQKLKQFPDELQAGALYVLANGTVVVDGIVGEGVFPNDVLYVSHDHGHSWDVQNEGSGAQGVYMDGKTGERWRVSGFSLYKRQVK